jgi:hypothetical protein
MSARREEASTTPWDLIHQDYKEWLANAGITKLAFNAAELPVLGSLKSQYDQSSPAQQQDMKNKRQRSTAYRVHVVVEGARHFAGARGNVFRMLEKYGAAYAPSDGGVHRHVKYIEDSLHVEALFLSWEQACGFQSAMNEWEIKRFRFANPSGMIFDPKTPMEVERPYIVTRIMRQDYEPTTSESSFELINDAEPEVSTQRGPARQSRDTLVRRDNPHASPNDVPRAMSDSITTDSATENMVVNRTAIGTGRGLHKLQGKIRRQKIQPSRGRRCRQCRLSSNLQRQVFAAKCSGRGGAKFCNWKEVDAVDDAPGWL